MCDYSLMAVPNRLAQEGEELVTYRFPTGSLGMASPHDVARSVTAAAPARKSFFSMLKEFFNPPVACTVPAVCIPPGARLRVQGLPERLQQSLAVQPNEEVTFTQLSAAAHTYRDALHFANGRDVRLQELSEGMRVMVVDLSCAEELDLEALRFEREALRVR
jgi:hypothetical protein